MMNAQQKLAIKTAIDGHNFVLLGSAGTGKSTVVAEIVKELTSNGKKVALTCATGIACRVYDQKLKATTVHRFLGIGDGRHEPTEIGPWILSSPSHADVINHIRETDVVIIDECSMISARTLHSISEVLSLKDQSKMFGGTQVILCGDFRQLPPVKDISYGDDGSYCFESNFFDTVFPHRVVLTEIVRQSDRELINCILEVSKGNASEETVKFIQSLSRNLQETDVSDIHLFARNDIVDDYNRKQILDFPGQLFEFTATDEGDDQSKLKKLTVPKKLWLKIGIPVILLRNVTDRLVNGLRGVVFDIDEDGPIVEFKDVGITTQMTKFPFEVFSPRLKRNVAIRTQYPIKPAFGLTVHKAQGMTLDRVHIDCRDIFQAGQLGVAVSRVKSKEGLSVSNFHPKFCIKHPRKVTEFIDKETLKTLEDRSCCRNCRRNETSQAVILNDDALSVPIDVDLNLEEDDVDENQFDEEFNLVIQEMDSDADKLLEFSLPDDFCCEKLVNKIKTEHPCTESQHNINQIVTELPLFKLELFCKKEFLAITEIVDDLKIAEPRSVPAKELGQFCVRLRKHFTSVSYKMNCVSLFEYTNERLTDDHFSICCTVQEFIRDFLLKQKTNLYLNESQNIRRRFVTSPSKARLRYVAGFCIAKLRHNYSQKKNTHRFSLSSEGQRIYEESDFSLTILNLLKEEEEFLKSYTTDESSLIDITRRQNLARSLTNIPDDIFFFFTRLCEICLSLLVADNLDKFGEEMFTSCLNHLLNNKDIETEFIEKVSSKMTVINIQTQTSRKLTENQDLKFQYSKKIYAELVKKFLKVLFAQFRKDVKSSYHVEKTLAHRKQIQVSKKAKQTVSATVTQATANTSFTDTTEASTSTTASTSHQPQTKKRKSSGGRRKSKGKTSATKTSGTYVDEAGETIWVCPSCSKEDDGIQHMIGCDICDEWYHWNCVGLTTEPEEEMWFCPTCDSKHTQKKRRGKKS